MEEKILSAFLYNHKLKFNEIEKFVKIRSNKLAYYLKKFEKKGILEKDKDFYKLSETTECLIPYLTKKQSVLPVILVMIKDINCTKNIFLIERKKRPYKDFLSLPGGRILLGETIPKASERIMKEKFNIKCKFKKINSISLEHIKKNKKIIHSFLLIFTTAKTKDKIDYMDIEKNKRRIIKSDYKLIKENIDKEIQIKNIFSRI